MTTHRILLPVAVVAALTACASGDVVLQTPPEAYVQDAPARVAAADWSQAETVEVALSEYEFSPATLSFEAGEPYLLVLRNEGTSTHTFTSPGFYRAIAAQKLVAGNDEQALPYIEQIEIPSGSSKGLYFLPVRKGTYALECAVFLHESFGMHGEITIR
jgi:uncharacterized cupredoxin-like copper-binding protein